MQSSMIDTQLTYNDISDNSYIHSFMNNGIKGNIGKKHWNLCQLHILSEYDSIIFIITTKGDV